MRYIRERNVRKLDFKLLELFQAIRQCRSVSQAALLLEIPQPTASRGLSRLREALDDELFVRTANGMEATAKGVEAGELIEHLLALANKLEVEARGFRPESSDREFVVAGSDVGQWTIMPAFYNLVSQCPGIRLRAIAVPGGDLAQGLENGDIDLAFGPYPSLLGNIKEQSLYTEHYRCFCRKDHPFALDPSLETYVASNHLLTLGRATAHAHRNTETLLRKIVSPHQIRVIGESYFVALATLMESDLLLTSPGTSLAKIANKFGIASVMPPIDLQPLTIKQYWHNRSDDDDGHKWLRSIVYKATAELRRLSP